MWSKVKKLGLLVAVVLVFGALFLWLFSILPRSLVPSVMQEPSIITIEPLLATVQSEEDIFVKVERIGSSPTDRDLGVALVPVGRENDFDAILHSSVAVIPRGETSIVHQVAEYNPWRRSEHAVSRVTVSYEVLQCDIPYYGLCEMDSCPGDTLVPCEVEGADTVTFHIQPRDYEAVVDIKPVKERVSDKKDVAFEITRSGDISEYMGVSVHCNSVGYHSFRSFPFSSQSQRHPSRRNKVDRIFIPAGERSVRYPFIIDNEYATNVECQIVDGDGYLFKRWRAGVLEHTKLAKVWIVDGLPKVGMEMYTSDAWDGRRCQREDLPDHLSSCRGAVWEGSRVDINIRRVGDTSYPLTIAIMCHGGDFTLGGVPSTITIPAGELYADVVTIQIKDDAPKVLDGIMSCKILEGEEYDVITKQDPIAIFGIGDDRHTGIATLWVLDND